MTLNERIDELWELDKATLISRLIEAQDDLAYWKRKANQRTADDYADSPSDGRRARGERSVYAKEETVYGETG